MTALDVRIELAKLAHELRVDPGDLAFLEVLTAAEVARLRALATQALFSPHEHRFSRLAKAAKLVPPPMAAKVTQVALTPLVAARVSAVIDPPLAVRMSSHFDPAYLAKVTPHLDPTRTAPVVTGLPEDLLVDVGRRMVAAEQWVALGRFVSLISAEASLRVVEQASGLELLRIALHTDDPSSLEAVIDGLPDDRLGDIARAAEEAGEVDEALALLGGLSSDIADRVAVSREAGCAGRTA